MTLKEDALINPEYQKTYFHWEHEVVDSFSDFLALNDDVISFDQREIYKQYQAIKKVVERYESKSEIHNTSMLGEYLCFTINQKKYFHDCRRITNDEERKHLVRSLELIGCEKVCLKIGHID